ncbi:regucalcin-like [Diorhabda carinulata]|uniref:regucalcin-like n=1 Tax=Diorhabda carinulata TaxID=1163345 RepID=UPI0025A20039|nr:regucalcin-like [Diorhabda carinulata]
MAPTIEKLCGNFKLGEAPFWDESSQVLYFVDINGYTINKYDPKTKKHTSAYVGKNVSIIIPVKGKKDQFVITLERELMLVTWDGVSPKPSKMVKLLEVDQNTKNVFNDGKCDPSGKLWIGTMGGPPVVIADIPLGKGTLYSIQNKKSTPHLTGIGIANGLAFNTELKKMYYIDSRTGTVDQYDWDTNKGSISNGTPIFTAKKNGLDGMVFDGMTIDTDGNLYVAVWGSRVIKIDPKKPETLLDTFHMPAKIISSVCFGGANLDELYVTSGQVGITPGPDDGATFKITGINAKGFAEVPVDLEKM